MKNHFKKVNLIWLLLWILLMICFINVTNWATKIITTKSSSEHMVRIHSLFLWNNSNDNNAISMKINTGEKVLNVEGWFAIWSGHIIDSNTDSSTIGWWYKNTIKGKNSWIVWWSGNTINGTNSLIGWWKENTINTDNAIIWWWNNNTVNSRNGLIAWWRENKINWENSIILWGQKNTINGENSLSFWQNSYWNTWSFVIGLTSKAVTGNSNSARIDVSSGVLIWTVTPIDWVRLVVSWAVSLIQASSTNWWTGWEIRIVDWCVRAFDGKNWQVMWKSSREWWVCWWPVEKCQFWETILYQWDQVDAYTNFWSLNENCSDKKVHITCTGWNLVNDNNGTTGPFYPYCYKIGGEN